MIAQAPSRSDVQARVQAVQAEILGLGVRRSALSGSVRRDTAHPDSDVDLLVEFEPEQKTLAHLVDLGDLLESVLGRHILAEADLLVELRTTRRNANPAVEWCAMARMRDRLIHDQRGVDIAWRVLQSNIPALQEEVRRILGAT